ncbi:MAG: hypothetical protein J6U02_01805 [Elusimicrobia bacterium]|nr:hypothetical protein [Elusimicrobiota bacterium]
MKKILILVCVFIFSFGFISCGKNGGGGFSDIYEVDIDFNGAPDPTKPTVVPVGQGVNFSVLLRKNGELVDSSDVSLSTFKASSVGNLRIWNDGGTIDFQGDKISKKYGEIADCKFGAVSGTGEFGLKATYKGTTATVTFSTN